MDPTLNLNKRLRLQSSLVAAGQEFERCVHIRAKSIVLHTVFIGQNFSTETNLYEEMTFVSKPVRCGLVLIFTFEMLT